VRPRLATKLRGQDRARIASLAEVDERAWAGSSSWVESPAKGRWGLSFADSDPRHDSKSRDCRAQLEDQMGAGLVPRTRAWARTFVFGETTDGVLNFYYAPSD